MPISNILPRELAKLTPQQLADLALQADQESRRCMRLGHMDDARKWDRESERLADAFQHA